MKRLNLPGFVELTNRTAQLFFMTAALLLSVTTVVGQTEDQVPFEPADAGITSEFGITKGRIVTLNIDRTAGRKVVASISINEKEYLLELHPNSVRSSSFELVEQIADGSYVERVPGTPRTIKGALIGSKGSRVVGSVLESGLAAKIVMGDGQVYFVEPLTSKIADDTLRKQHVLYRAEDTKPHAGICGVADGPAQRFEDIRIANANKRRFPTTRRDRGRELSPRGGGPSEGGPRGGGGVQVAELAVDADFEYFSDYGTVQATMNRMELIVNIVNDQYEDDVDITHVISGAVVRSAEPDPYTSTSANTLLTQFRTEWLNNQGGIQRDVAHLFTGKEIDGGTIGIAWTIGGICTTSAYCLSQSDFNGALVCSTDVTAHELGHLWNGSHCSCPGHTMNPSITCTNQFNPTFTIPDIIAHRNSRPCLDSAAPANDDWENKFSVGTLPATVFGTNDSASTQTNEQNLGNTGSTVWWSAISPGDGVMTVSTLGSSFDSQLHVFTGSENGFDNLQHLATNDDANGTLQSEIQFPVSNGQRYELRVGGHTNGGPVSEGDIELNVSFVPAGPTEFFWSDRNLNLGAANTSNAGVIVSEGSSGSIYFYYDPAGSDIDTGAFFDIATSIPGVIEFTVAETLEFNVSVGGVPVAVRWGDAFGETGDVSSDLINELGAVSIVAGTGMVNANTGPTLIDEGYDANVGAFLYARVDYNVIGPVGSSVHIISAPGETGIVNSGVLLNPGIGSIKITVGEDLPPTTDFFWSIEDLDNGAVNDSTVDASFAEGSSGSLFLYYDSLVSDIDTGAFLDIATSTSGVIEFTQAETFEFDITADGIPFAVRWGDGFGETGDVTPNFIDELGALNVVSGTGMLNQHTGPVVFDQGYDGIAQAFLFARIDFNVVGPIGSSVDIIASEGETGVVHSGMLINTTMGMATITVSDSVLLGDVNCDGIVDLLDVNPFVDLVTTGGYSAKADFNFDGEVNLLDVQPFVDALTGG